jgi:5-methylthioadenosine/S-adenosylhomocysteine deaminase
MTHCLETDWRLNAIREKFSTSTVQVLENADLLNEKSILFHCIQVTKEDIAEIGKAHATVVCCPTSTLRGSEGIMPLQDMLAHNVNITIGTDFIEHDIWDAMRCLYTTLSDPSFTPMDREATVFAMATSNAGVIFNKNGYSGSIHLGASADICCIAHTAELDPLVESHEFSNVLHNVLMQGGKEMVRHLLVNGNFVVYDGKCRTIDEDQVVADYRKLVAKLVAESRT